jgi:hypothetical protein
MLISEGYDSTTECQEVELGSVGQVLYMFLHILDWVSLDEDEEIWLAYTRQDHYGKSELEG